MALIVSLFAISIYDYAIVRYAVAAVIFIATAVYGIHMGISIANAQNDYFNLTLVYKNIREAVDILNPAPKN